MSDKRAVKAFQKARRYLSVKAHFDPDEPDGSCRAVCVYGAVEKFSRVVSSSFYMTQKEIRECMNWHASLTWSKAKTILDRMIRRAKIGKGWNPHGTL